jgi:hypothetical protein
MSQFTTTSVIYGADIDGTATGSTAIVTLPNGYAVSQLQVISTSISGVILGPTFSIGTNSPDYNNIASLVVLTGLSAANNVLSITGANPAAVFNEDDIIYLKVTTAALATTYDFQIILLGYPI